MYPRQGEYIDFATLTTKATFGASELASQTSLHCTLELAPSGDSFAIQPTSSHKRILSFPAWLRPGIFFSNNGYLKVTKFNDFSDFGFFANSQVHYVLLFKVYGD